MNALKSYDMHQMEIENEKEKKEFLNNEFHKKQIQPELIQNENRKKENSYIQDSEKHILGILNSEYNLIKVIGSGASGAVYLSYSIYDTNIPKTFHAIKVIYKKDPNDNIDCEVSYVKKMNHENIIKVYGHGYGILQTSPGLIQQVYYIIMEYIDHGSLLQQIGDNVGFGEDLGRLIFAQLLDGLETIHNSNIVHRDIKLENIMLSGNDYTLKYVDFGFATERSYGYLTSYLGTPNYAAPEIHLRRPYLGTYEDIFSLGVTLFITVTGYLPFVLPHPNDPLYHYIYDVDYISYWRNRRIKVSPSFMELFDNLIAFEPTQRPSISEIRNSKWMKEINWELFPLLKAEFMKRENIYNQKMLLKKEKIMKINIGKINHDNNIANNNISKADQLLLRIREEQKMDVVNDIKKHLFPVNYTKENIKGNSKALNESTNEDDTDNENKTCKKNGNQGFVNIKLNTKNLNSLMILLKQFLRKEGYNLINKNMNNLSMELSNGEIDVLLSFEKILKDIKITFIIENGNKEDFNEFKKLMKKFSSIKKK